jgi:hypothetical protein
MNAAADAAADAEGTNPNALAVSAAAGGGMGSHLTDEPSTPPAGGVVDTAATQHNSGRGSHYSTL